MRFLADEGVDRSVVEGLRLLNFDVYYVIEETRSLSDDELLHIAFTENRILITKELGFRRISVSLTETPCRCYLDQT